MLYTACFDYLRCADTEACVTPWFKGMARTDRGLSVETRQCDKQRPKRGRKSTLMAARMPTRLAWRRAPRLVRLTNNA